MRKVPDPGSTEGPIYEANTLGELRRAGLAYITAHCLRCPRVVPIRLDALIGRFPWGPATPLPAVARKLGPCSVCGAMGAHVEPFVPAPGTPGYVEWEAAQRALSAALLAGRWNA